MRWSFASPTRRFILRLPLAVTLAGRSGRRTAALAGEPTGREGAVGRHVRRPPRIAGRRQPDRFKLVRAWRAETVGRPGNLVCCTDGADSRIVALDGGRTVVELEPGGGEVARHELALPSEAQIAFLRTAVDAAGRRWWLGGSRGGRQVFVFDGAWHLHAAYPDPPNAAGPLIKTAQLVDLDADGVPEVLVAHQDAVAMHVASLEGRPLWPERAFDAVLDVVPDAPRDDRRRGLVCVDVLGKVVAVSVDSERIGTQASSGEARAGRQPRFCGTSNAAVASLYAGPVAADGTWAFLGLAGSAEGRNLAMGLGPLPEQCWELELPDGDFEDGGFEPVAWADLLGTPRRQWIIAAPDGSITVAWADGRVMDRYRHGEPLVGIGGYRHAKEGFIVIATAQAVEGYRVDDVALD